MQDSDRRRDGRGLRTERPLPAVSHIETIEGAARINPEEVRTSVRKPRAAPWKAPLNDSDFNHPASPKPRDRDRQAVEVRAASASVVGGVLQGWAPWFRGWG